MRAQSRLAEIVGFVLDPDTDADSSSNESVCGRCGKSLAGIAPYEVKDPEDDSLYRFCHECFTANMNQG